MFFVNNAFFCFLEKPAQPAQSTPVDPSGGASGKGHLLGAGGSAASRLEGFIPDTGPPSTAQQLPASTCVGALAACGRLTQSLSPALHLGPCLTESRDTGCQA